MTVIVPAGPAFNAKEYVQKVNNEKKVLTNFNDYGVGLTDVEEKYIDWKYTQQYKFKLFFQKLTTTTMAHEAYEEFVNCGYQPLGFDPVDIHDPAKCKNIFIVRLPNS